MTETNLSSPGFQSYQVKLGFLVRLLSLLPCWLLDCTIYCPPNHLPLWRWPMFDGCQQVKRTIKNSLVKHQKLTMIAVEYINGIEVGQPSKEKIFLRCL